MQVVLLSSLTLHFSSPDFDPAVTPNITDRCKSVSQPGKATYAIAHLSRSR